jgi:hypothetical protein
MVIISVTKSSCYFGVPDEKYLWIIADAEIKKMTRQYSKLTLRDRKLRASNGGLSQKCKFINTAAYSINRLSFPKKRN